MTEILLARFTTATRDQTLAELLHAKGHPLARPQKAETGKPYLQEGDTRRGLSVTHIRRARPPFSFMAVADDPAFAIDAEIWPVIPSDTAFLESVRSPEDAAILPALQKLGANPATLLWVIKEAALKASGEVMTDPRHLAVKRAGNAFTVEPSVSASSPVPAAKICLFDLPSSASHPRVLLAAAQVDIERKVIGGNGQISLKALNLQVISINLT